MNKTAAQSGPMRIAIVPPFGGIKFFTLFFQGKKIKGNILKTWNTVASWQLKSPAIFSEAGLGL
jgi:hypothetical protein